MEGVGRAGLEVKLLIPPPGLLVLGVHHQSADAGDVGGLCGAPQGVLEERPAKTHTLIGAVNGGW